jgi:VanZ family protein
MLHKLIVVLAWACLAFIVFATLSPLALRPRLSADETALIVIVERVGAFALLGLLFSISYSGRPFVIAIVFGSAILLELLQLIVAGRDAGVIDVIEKLVGGTLGVVAAAWLSSFSPALTQPPREE